MKSLLNLPSLARLVAAVLLFVAVARMPYGYYILIRWVVCGIAAYSAVQARTLGKTGWTWIFGFIALFFNPVIPVHLGRQGKEIWALVDVAVGVVMLVSIFFFRETDRGPITEATPSAKARD
jgi:hypothetical protein